MPPKYSPNVSAVTTKDNSTLDQFSASASSIIHNIESLLQRLLEKSGNTSIFAFTITGTSLWYFDSTCYNHMTSDSTIFSSETCPPNLPFIQTADGSSIHVSHLGHISLSNLSLLDIFLTLKLKLNLISVGLCDLGLNILFTSSGYYVHDPKTSRICKEFIEKSRVAELRWST